MTCKREPKGTGAGTHPAARPFFSGPCPPNFHRKEFGTRASRLMPQESGCMVMGGP